MNARHHHPGRVCSAGMVQNLARQATAAIPIATVFLCAGCHSYTSLAVHVKDARTGQPVAGAAVFVDAPDPRHPARVLDLVNPFSPEGGRGLTDPNGLAQVRCVSGRPVQVRVVAPGHVPQAMFFERAPDSTDWLSPDPSGTAAMSGLAVRFGP